MLKTEIQIPSLVSLWTGPKSTTPLTKNLFGRLTQTFQDLGTRPDVRAIVLQGNGKSFSAGADLNWTNVSPASLRKKTGAMPTLRLRCF